MIRAGQMRTRVTLQRPVESNERGETVTTWQTYATVWAHVRPLSAREYLMAQQVQAAITHQVMIRYRPDVSAKHRIIAGDRTLHLAAPPQVPDDYRDQLILLCEEVE